MWGPPSGVKAGGGGDIASGNLRSYLRDEFSIGNASGEPLIATGLRLLIPHTGLSQGTEIDELEVYGTPIGAYIPAEETKKQMAFNSGQAHILLDDHHQRGFIRNDSGKEVRGGGRGGLF